jgi:hypothetical protein
MQCMGVERDNSSNEREIKSTEEEMHMANQEKNKCAHIPCLCDVTPGQEYCSESCQDAGNENVEVACQCDHPSCPLTV